MTRIRSAQTATEIRSESARLVDLSSRVMTGDPWHAGNVEDLLADVTVREAIARPLPGRASHRLSRRPDRHHQTRAAHALTALSRLR